LDAANSKVLALTEDRDQVAALLDTEKGATAALKEGMCKQAEDVARANETVTTMIQNNETLQGELARVAAECDEATNQLGASSKRVEELECQISDLSAKIASTNQEKEAAQEELTQEIVSLQSQNSELLAIVEERDVVLDGLRTECAELGTQMMNAKVEVDRLLQENKALREELDAIRNDRDVASSRQEEAEKVFKSATLSLEAAIDLQKNELVKKENELSAALSELQHSREKVAAIESEAKRCKEASTKALAESARIQKGLAVSLEENVRCKQKINELEKAQRAKTDEMSSLTEEKERLKNELARAIKQLDSTKMELDSKLKSLQVVNDLVTRLTPRSEISFQLERELEEAVSTIKEWEERANSAEAEVCTYCIYTVFIDENLYSAI
jgi:chromosome segregation ATPase